MSDTSAPDFVPSAPNDGSDEGEHTIDQGEPEGVLPEDQD